MVDSATVVLSSGTAGPKRTIAVLGDGFTAAEQGAYDDAVRRMLLQGVFGHDCFAEDAAAFRIVRVNLESADSGVSQRVYDEHGTPTDSSDDTIISTTIRNTPLGYIYSGSWAHCWLEGSAHTDTRVQQALDRWVPDYDLVVVILNELGFGGCGGGGFQVVTLAGGWTVMAHEFGHGAGGLADEYCQPGTWPGGEPGAVNLTTVTDRAALKWARYVAPTTPLPTGINPTPGSGGCTNWNQGERPANWSSSDDVGLFEGASYRDSGVYRPVENCRMRGNSPPYCPVCYGEIKRQYDPLTRRAFSSVVAADLDGDGRDEVVVHNAGSLATFGVPADGRGLAFAAHAVGSVGAWPIGASDRFLAADVDGDGRDELIAVTGESTGPFRLAVLHGAPDADGAGGRGLALAVRYDGAVPGWQLGRHDQWLAADLDGDGRAELVVLNTRDWAVPYLGVLRYDAGILRRVVRYDGSLPGWTMRRHDRMVLTGQDGAGAAEVVLFNGQDWAVPYLARLCWTGSGFAGHTRHQTWLAGWTMRAHDRHLLADLDADGAAELVLFNGQDWAIPYLGVLKRTDTGWTRLARYDGSLPGWTMRPHDRFQLLRPTADAHEGLLVSNTADWSTGYLAALTSDAGGLHAHRVAGRVGEWRLTPEDGIEVASLAGTGGASSVVLHSTDCLAVAGCDPAPTLQRFYRRWIHDYRYGHPW